MFCKPLKTKRDGKGPGESAACAIIFLTGRSQVVDSKYGEMSEWLKEHAWKTIPASCIE